MVTEYWQRGLIDSIKQKRQSLIRLRLQLKGHLESVENLKKAIKELEDEIERIAKSEAIKDDFKPDKRVRYLLD